VENAVSRGVIASVRDLMPLRPLTRDEARLVAEDQTNRFLTLVGVTEPPVPEQVIAELPRLRVSYRRGLPVSGASEWARGAWQITINADEPHTRRRLSLAHELKHILDHPFFEIIYPDAHHDEHHRSVERLADYFAGNLLMPRDWVEEAFTQTNHLSDLAWRFHVSRTAMATRLNQLGLQPQPRRPRQRPDLYQRGAPSPLLLT
jgi:predicted transcriptional regulator